MTVLRTSRLVFTARLRPQFRTPPVPNASSSECPRASIAARRRAASSIRISRRASCCCSSAIAGIVIGANFKIYLFRQFVRIESNFFTIHRRHRRKKMMDQNFEIRILWFLRFFEIFKKASRGPLRPIWTILVAAKLDHSRSLWPSFVKIGQRWKVEVPVRDTHTDRQTDKQLKIRPFRFAIGPTDKTYVILDIDSICIFSTGKCWNESIPDVLDAVMLPVCSK